MELCSFPTNRQHDQNLNNDTFVRLPVISAQVVIGTGMYPDTDNLLNYSDDDYSQGYDQIKEAFKALTENNILNPYITEDDFRSFNDGDNMVIIYTALIFVIRKNFKVVNRLQ